MYVCIIIMMCVHIYMHGAWLYMDDFVYFVAKYEWFVDKSLINYFF